MNEKRIAVIGAGMAGLVCADRLTAAGAAVTVLEKSRDIGGRLASRRRHGASWNHGAPAVQAHDPAFSAFLRELIAAGSARADMARVDAFAGEPDMRELLRPLAGRLDIHFSATVQRLFRSGSAWWLALAEGAAPLGPFDGVLATPPAPQIVELFARSALEVPTGLEDVTMLPCWTLLLGFAAPADALTGLTAGDVFERAIRQPPAAGTGIADRWVLHAAQAWTDANLALDRDRAQRQLWEALRELVGELPPTVYAAAHRWRYARVQHPLGRDHLWLPDRGLGFAGDWCPGGDAQGAFLSGHGLGIAVQQGGNGSLMG